MRLPRIRFLDSPEILPGQIQDEVPEETPPGKVKLWHKPFNFGEIFFSKAATTLVDLLFIELMSHHSHV